MIVIERLDANIALLEIDGQICQVARELLPEQAKEGDLLIEQDGRYHLDKQGTKARAAHIRRMMDDLFE